MMYSCAPRSGSSSAVVKSKKRGSLRIDIHCHYLNPDAAAKVAPLNPARTRCRSSSPTRITRETNKKQVAERAPKLSSIEVRLKDMDRQGIDIQAVSPAPQQTYYWTEPKMGAELARQVNERLADIVAKWPERFVGLGTVPLQDPDMAVSELEYCVKKLGMRGVEINRQRQRHGPHRRPARPGQVLRQGAGARRHHLHASHRLYPGRAPARPLLQQRDRQSRSRPRWRRAT